jgi:hypothetical protein
MGIAIAAGAGLLLGLGLLVWGLRERSKRHTAERAADKAESLRAQAADAANHNATRAVEMEDQAVRLTAQLDTLRGRLAEVRELVVDKAPIETVKALIDTESKDEVI